MFLRLWKVFRFFCSSVRVWLNECAEKLCFCEASSSACLRVIVAENSLKLKSFNKNINFLQDWAGRSRLKVFAIHTLASLCIQFHLIFDVSQCIKGESSPNNISLQLTLPPTPLLLAQRLFVCESSSVLWCHNKVDVGFCIHFIAQCCHRHTIIIIVPLNFAKHTETWRKLDFALVRCRFSQRRRRSSSPLVRTSTRHLHPYLEEINFFSCLHH